MLRGVQLHRVPTAERISRWLDVEACGVVTSLKDWLEVLCERKKWGLEEEWLSLQG